MLLERHPLFVSQYHPTAGPSRRSHNRPMNSKKDQPHQTRHRDHRPKADDGHQNHGAKYDSLAQMSPATGAELESADAMIK